VVEQNNPHLVSETVEGIMERKSEGAPSTQERLLKAALQVLLASGYAGASTREIAAVAGVNPVMLFRLFSTKADLLAAALIAHAAAAQEALCAPTGALEADLVALGETLLGDHYMRDGHLMRLLMEVRHLPEEQQHLVVEAQTQVIETIIETFSYYQRAGALKPASGDHLWNAFVGPILVAVLRGDVYKEAQRFDLHEHVWLFLQGCRVPPPV
jgi:AcrR family transcriptional regulator